MSSKNINLNAAKQKKDDEFYTRLEDIEKALNPHADLFKDQIIYCNCDDYLKSQFVHYFEVNFQRFGLKKLIATHYSEDGVSMKYVKTRSGVAIERLKGNGDFRNEENIELLKNCDLVITNPPFSLFREYIDQLMTHDKTFMIIGNQNAMTCKDIYPLIRDSKMWPINIGSILFNRPNMEASAVYVCWFTNFIPKEKKELILTKTYDPNDYVKYDNADAIEVGRLKDIPADYDGIMGVPITFLHYWPDDRFKIIKKQNNFLVNGRRKYQRVLIQKKEGE